MSEFLVEAYQPSSEARHAPPRDAIAAAAREMTLEGRPVRLVRAVRVPDDELCLYLFEAATSEAVIEAAQRCGLRYERVVLATSA